MPRSKLNAKPLLWAVAALSMLTVALFIIYLFIFQQAKTNAAQFPIQGFDVSHHQKDIQWHKISPQQYHFVYLKATEGGDFSDRKFQENWLKAREQGLHVGAYHFYRLCRDGMSQAQHFIATVPKKADALPPVMDLEYDSKCINHYTQEQLLKQIQIMHDQLYQHYQKQPIFYTSKAFYNIVLAGHFNQTPLWVREYKSLPDLKGQPKWLFWQHSNKGKIQGIQGTVDLNVFYGDAQDWQNFLIQNQVIAIP